MRKVANAQLCDPSLPTGPSSPQLWAGAYHCHGWKILCDWWGLNPSPSDPQSKALYPLGNDVTKEYLFENALLIFFDFFYNPRLRCRKHSQISQLASLILFLGWRDHCKFQAQIQRGGACNTGRLFERPVIIARYGQSCYSPLWKVRLENGYYIKWSVSKQNPWS